MTIRLIKLACVSLAVLPLIAVPSLASDVDPSEQAYRHYRCDALVQLGKMNDQDRIACDELKSSDFDLVAWESDNRETSTKLHEKVFSEFF